MPYGAVLSQNPYSVTEPAVADPTVAELAVAVVRQAHQPVCYCC